MIGINKVLKTKFQWFVDKSNGKPIDIAGFTCYSIIFIIGIFFLVEILRLSSYPVLNVRYNPNIFSLIIILPIFTFYMTMAGDYLKKPYTRIHQFVFCIVMTSLFTFRYLIQVSNASFVGMLKGIKNLDVVPYSLIEGNIRMVTFFVPTILVLPIVYLIMTAIFDKEIKKEILEYSVDWLLPNVHKMDDTTIDVVICKDVETGEDCIVPEKNLNEHTWLQGGTGSGKTSNYILPLLKQLFYKKGYLREKLKEVAFECLKDGIAYLTVPVSKHWARESFSMDILLPVKGKEDLFYEKFKPYIIGKMYTGQYVYKGVGVKVVSPDGELSEKTMKIAKEFGVKVHKIDPTIEEIAKGNIAKFNPLNGGTPEKTGDIVSSILISMDQTDSSKANPYFTNASVRAIRNIVILIKVMYPRLYNYEPVLTDVLAILNNFNLVQPLVEAMKESDELKERWGSVISYFETSFYPPDLDNNGKPIPTSVRGSQRKKTQEAISGIINQLDNFLGREEIKYILCDRKNSLNLAEVLKRGECIAIATRQNNLGKILGKAFAGFFILSMQTEVLSRYSENENPEIPHHLIIDEFPFYVNDDTKVFFTFARKYKTACTIAIQNMGQLKEVSDQFGETIFTNTSTKLLLPKSNVEDRKYWAEYFGTIEKVELETGVNKSSMLSSRPNYSESAKGKLVEKNNVSEQEINDLEFKKMFYAYTDSKGKQRIGKGMTDFLKIKENEKIESAELNFAQFNIESAEEHNARLVKEKLLKQKIDLDQRIQENPDIEMSFGENSNPKEIDTNIEIDADIDIDLGSRLEIGLNESLNNEKQEKNFEIQSSVTEVDIINDKSINIEEIEIDFLDTKDNDNESLITNNSNEIEQECEVKGVVKKEDDKNLEVYLSGLETEEFILKSTINSKIN